MRTTPHQCVLVVPNGLIQVGALSTPFRNRRRVWIRLEAIHSVELWLMAFLWWSR